MNLIFSVGSHGLSASVRLEPLTIVFGSNDSGKSTLLQAITQILGRLGVEATNSKTVACAAGRRWSHPRAGTPGNP